MGWLGKIVAKGDRHEQRGTDDRRVTRIAGRVS